MTKKQIREIIKKLNTFKSAYQIKPGMQVITLKNGRLEVIRIPENHIAGYMEIWVNGSYYYHYEFLPLSQKINIWDNKISSIIFFILGQDGINSDGNIDDDIIDQYINKRNFAREKCFFELQEI